MHKTIVMLLMGAVEFVNCINKNVSPEIKLWVTD